MNDLATITTMTGRTMASREIAELTGKSHGHVLRDIKSLIEQGAVNQSNFGLVDYTDAKGEKRPEYLLDFDATMTLVTGYNANLRAKVIARWRELETGAANPAIPKDLPTALRAYADEVEKNQALMLENKTMRPKALFADAVASSKSCILVGELAKVLKQNGVDIGQNRLFAWLRENGWLIRRAGADYNMPTQKAMERGLFEIKEGVFAHADGHLSITKTPKLTGKGQVYFVNLFLKGADEPEEEEAA